MQLSLDTDDRSTEQGHTYCSRYALFFYMKVTYGRPPSATVQWICLTGFGLAAITFFVLRSLEVAPLHIAVGCMLALAISIGLLDVIFLAVRQKSADSGLDFDPLA